MNNSVPAHVAIIMDGNRRWARSRGLTVKRGHLEGAETLRKIALYAFGQGVEYLSVYAFSTENWQRSSGEVKHLMQLVSKGFEKYFDEFNNHGIKIVRVGGLDNVSPKILNIFNEAEEKTKNNKAGTLAICFNYGGQDEIVKAVQDIVDSKISSREINVEQISKHLFVPELPPVDIMVRTSGEHRISNFMLWRLAYSELMFLDKYWPDFNENDIDDIIEEYNKRQRRFGT